MGRSSWTLGVALALLGCGPQVGVDADTAEGSSTTLEPSTSSTVGSTTVVTTTTSSSTTTSTTTAADSSTGGSESTETTLGFIQDPDGGSVCACCDTFAQDCGDGQKCAPMLDAGVGFCCPTRCVEIADAPAAIGEPCNSLGLGDDDCALGAFCATPSAEASEGVCVALCTGSEAQPTCAGDCTSCWIDEEHWAFLCLPPCDPLAPECPAGSGCYRGGDTFACVMDSSDRAGAMWTECYSANDCDPGLSCMQTDAIEGCDDICCVPACDPLDPLACSDAPGGMATCLEIELDDDVAACLPGPRGLCG